MGLRRSSRLVLLDEDDRVLLFRIEDATVFDPKNPRSSSIFWVTPGGAVRDGESHEDAARRELWEETGIEGIELGPCIWISDHELDWKGEMTHCHDRFYLVRVRAVEIKLDYMEDEERDVNRGHRWWSVHALRASDEVVYPPGLGDQLAPITAGVLPSSPIRLS